MTLKALLTLVRLPKGNPPSNSQLLVLPYKLIMQNQAIYPLSLHTKPGLLSAVVSVGIKLKLARITPIFKKGSRFDEDNYRPISVLSNLSKIIEKAMYQLLYRCLEDFRIL